MKQLNQQDILNYLRENRDLLEREFGVTKIALFGSYARNEAHENSDIDLLIEAKVHSYRNRFYLKEHLENHFNRKIDIGYFSSIRSIIRLQIEKELIYA